MAPVRKGKLKIFFSYGQRAGKTQAMLWAAHEAARQNTDVAVGFISPQVLPQTRKLLEGLETVPPLMGREAAEFDLDRALARQPELILVDQLEHTNSSICRHRKRYQDVGELLKSGIDVYTTLDVTNLESLHDTVASIIGQAPVDRVPDSVFDQADQLEMIDIEPQDLRGRFQEEGLEESAFTLEQLTALREIALRRLADRVRRRADAQQRKFQTNEHILACLSAAPSNARIIRTAARMARAFNSQFTALFIQTPDFAVASPEDKQRLQENQKLAEQLGANIEMIYGEDVPCQIAEFARLSGVTKIVLGRSAVARRHWLGKPTLTEQLLSYVPEMDIHIIPDLTADKTYQPRRARRQSSRDILINGGKSLGILLGATLLGLLVDRLGFSESNIIMIYIFSVLLTSIATSHRVYSLLSSLAAVLLFNFLFTEPRYCLTAYAKEYPFTFAVMFITAYVTGTFAISYQEQAGQSAKTAYRSKILFDTDQLLSKVKNRDEIIRVAAGQIGKLLGRNVVIFSTDDGRLSEPHLFPIHPGKTMEYDPEQEKTTVEWVLRNNHAAGATTDTLSGARYLYLALRINEQVYGVVGIEAENNPLDAGEHGVLLSILSECALALENEKNAREKDAAAVLAESEQLRANLLRTISHDLRTPLTTISGNASNLISNGSSFDEQTKQRIYTDIYDDSMWLINLVENLLSATRIEEGRMILKASTELLDDIVEEAMRHISRKITTHRLSTRFCDELLLVRADPRLIEQVIVNIVDNAVKYTPAGTEVTVSTGTREGMAYVRIADTGGGIPACDRQHIFDKFYCGTNRIADNRRSLGLGLYLCRAVVEAHGGTIEVTDNQPHGTVFTFTLPLEEVTLHE